MLRNVAPASLTASMNALPQPLPLAWDRLSLLRKEECNVMVISMLHNIFI